MEHTRTITGLILLCLLTALVGFFLPNTAGTVLASLTIVCAVTALGLCIWNVLRLLGRDPA